jgi:hypothetical protein
MSQYLGAEEHRSAEKWKWSCKKCGEKDVKESALLNKQGRLIKPCMICRAVRAAG